MEQFANNPSTTLGAAITSTTATSITVASATGFPSSGNFRILIDTEIMEVTAVGGTTWTVSRADGGSTAATHLNAAAVTGILTAEALNNLVAIEQAGTVVSSRRTLNFIGGVAAGPVADNSGSNRCDITLGPDATLVYPYGNLSYGRPYIASHKDISVSASGTYTLLDTTGGANTPGYIDNIWIGINDSSSTNARELSTISIYRDGEGSPSFVCTTGSLMMLFWGPAGFSTRYIGALTYSDSGSGYIGHKIPWTQNIKVVFTNGDTSNGITLYSDISYKTGANINWGRAAHFLCNHAVATSVAAYAAATLLNVSGTGLFYGLCINFEGGDGNYNYLEGAISIYIDGESSPSMVWSGTEDYFLQGQYFSLGTALCSDIAGCTTKGYDGEQVSAYRFHIDDPIPFNVSVKVTWNAGNSTYATVSNSVNIWYAALYYLNA